MATAISYLFAAFIHFISIYTINVKNINGGDIDFASFSGKKILIVNTAGNSTKAVQYGELEKLHQLYKDSLVIIAFPSNDFGHEPDENASIWLKLKRKYSIHYLVAEKSIVSGADKNNLFKWLGDAKLNGMLNGTINKDFTKFLIDINGRITGVYSNEVSPLDAGLQQAIKAPSAPADLSGL